jgi:hypothetical protein
MKPDMNLFAGERSVLKTVLLQEPWELGSGFQHKVSAAGKEVRGRGAESPLKLIHREFADFFE